MNNFRNKIYYLYDLHKSCQYIIQQCDDIILKYIKYVNYNLKKYFTELQQKQLELYNFNYDLLYKIAYQDLPHNISFDTIEDNILYKFFDLICIEDFDIIKNLIII